MVLLLKAILEEHPTLEDITQHFLVPGHSFLRNDSDFSDIESCLKLQQRLYTPNDYIEVMKSCRKKNKLLVDKMENEDFVSTTKLVDAITNRKKSTEGVPINWLKLKVIQVRRSAPFELFVKSDLKQEEFVQVSIGKKPSKVGPTEKRKTNCASTSASSRKKRTPTRPSSFNHTENNTFFSSKLNKLWPQGKPISKEKLEDLKSMYHIPKDCLHFYKGLSSSDLIEDDIDGFSGQLDFDLEEDES